MTSVTQEVLEKDLGLRSILPAPARNFAPNSKLAAPVISTNEGLGAKFYQGEEDGMDEDVDTDVDMSTACPVGAPQAKLLRPDGLGGAERHPTATTKFALRKRTRGKQKISITYMHDRVRRCSTFSKRKNGLLKKARELSELTGADVLLVVASPTNHVYTYSTKRLRGMVESDEGLHLIYSCLGANQAGGGGGGSSSGGKDASGQTTPVCSSSTSPTRLDEDQSSGRVSISPPTTVAAVDLTTSPQGSGSTLLTSQLQPPEKSLSPLLLNSPPQLPTTAGTTKGLRLPTVVFANSDSTQTLGQTSEPSVVAAAAGSVLYASPDSSSSQALHLQDVTHFIQFSSTAAAPPGSSPDCGLASRFVLPLRVLQGLPNSHAVDDGHAFSPGSLALPFMQIQATQTDTNSTK